MHDFGRRQLGLGLAACASMLAPSALAHIDLRVPVPREQGLSLAENANLKMGPCGQVDNGRTDRVTVFAPNDTIEVTWAETTNHRSYYRIAFDRDGDDAFPVFAGPGIGTEGIDPRGLCPVDGQVILAYEMEDGAGGLHTLRVRLPDIECERCTLQVVQYMFDRMRPYYFQCADLALRRATADDAGAPDAGAERLLTTPRGEADAAGAEEPEAAAGCSSRIAPADAGLIDRDQDETPERDVPPPQSAGDMPTMPTMPAAPAPAPTAPREASGCSIGPWRGRGAHVALGLLCAASLGWRRSRRQTSVTRD